MELNFLQSLHHIICGVQRHLRFHGKPEIDFFKDAPFAECRMSLDAEMKRLQRCGLGSRRKKAKPISPEEEEVLWQKGVLGSCNPQSLDTMLYMCGLYFALRNIGEHRQVRFHQSQIQLVERPGERSYLQYTEDVSKNRQGGLKNRKLKLKVVIHYANDQNPERCFINLFKRYKSLYPMENLKKNAFYLQPLKNPTSQCWYSTKPIGHDWIKQQQGCAHLVVQEDTGRITHLEPLLLPDCTRLVWMSSWLWRRLDTDQLKVLGATNTSEQQLQQLSDILHGSSSTVNSASDSSMASIIQPLQQPLAVQTDKQENSTEISVHHNSASKNLTMNFTQTPSFNIQGCMVTINITHAIAP